MIPAPFEYARADSLDAALQALREADGSTTLLAGGQSLIPLLKLRLARPTRVLDIGRIGELRGVRREPDGSFVIGALTTWSELLAEPAIRDVGALADAIPGIGDRQVRNRGTIGGSIAHADPASDIAAAALALELDVRARSAARGERTIRAAELFVGPFATALEPDEILTSVRLPARAPAVASAYRALPQPASGYPIAGVAVVLERNAGGGFGRCLVGLTGVGEVPSRALEVEREVLDGTGFSDAARAVTDGLRVASDIHADREYRAAMAVEMTRRALEAAAARLD